MALSPLVFHFGARIYDWLTRPPAWRAHCAAMARRLGPGDGRVVLDLGCGPGACSLAIACALPGDTVIGLDLVEPMLRRAQALDGRRRCGWVRGDVHRLPFRDGSVDAITGHSFLYLLPDRAGALAEMRRVLRPGGALALLEPSRQAAAADARAVAAAVRAFGPHLALTLACWRIAARASGAFAPGALAEALAAAGFAGAAQEPTLLGLGWIAVARAPADARAAAG